MGVAGGGGGREQQRRRVRSVRRARRAGRLLHVHAIRDRRHLLVIAARAGRSVRVARVARRSQLGRVRLGRDAVARSRLHDVLVDALGKRGAVRDLGGAITTPDGRAASARRIENDRRRDWFGPCRATVAVMKRASIVLVAGALWGCGTSGGGPPGAAGTAGNSGTAGAAGSVGS